MSNMRQKKIAAAFICILLAAVLAAAYCGFISAEAQSSSQQSYSSAVNNGPYDEYTDSDSHNGITVEKYADHYSGNVSLYEERITEEETEKVLIHMQATRDNDITAFVPKDLFSTEGVKSCIGKEYGFIVDTFFVTGSDALHSIVMLFDINYKDEFIQTKGHLIITISPVFQGEFAYVTPQTEKILGAKKNVEAEYTDTHDGIIYIDAEAPVIVPVPVAKYGTINDMEGCEFRQINKYYLRNFKSLVNLYNENHLNAFDEGYAVTQDKGAFFTQMDFAYSAHFYKEGSINLLDAGKAAVNGATVGLDILRALNLVAQANPIIGIASGMVSFFADCIKLAHDAIDQLEGTDKVLTYVPEFTTAKEQIANNGYLTKDALIEVVSGAEQLVLTTGGSLTVDYQVSATDPSWRTRYVSSIIFDAFTVTDNGVESFTLSNNGYSNDLKFAYREEQTELEEGTDADVYLLPEGKQPNVIVPDYTGWYQLSTDIAGEYSSKVSDITDLLNIKEVEAIYDETNNAYRVYLQEGKTYLWEVGYSDQHLGGRQTCRYEFAPQIIALGNNAVSFDGTSSEYIQLKFENNYFYRLKTADGAELRLYDQNMQQIASGTELRVENGGGNSVYLSIHFPEAVTKDAIIECTKERDVEFITYTEEEIEGITVVNDEAVIFPVPADYSGYSFMGWWSNNIFEGEPITGETLSGVNQAAVTLHANWEPVVYDIIYHENGGSEVSDATYTIEDFIILDSGITRDGYIFKGWYDNESFTGEPVINISQGSMGDREYFAKWVQETYQVTFDEDNDFIDGQSAELVLDGTAYTGHAFTVNYGEGYRLPVASTKGFIFEGWYYGDVQLTDKDGNSIINYYYEADIGLLAKWRRESYTIKLQVDGGHFYWLVEGGLSSEEATIEYAADLCPNCMITALRNASAGNVQWLFRSGYIFNCLTTEPNDGTKVACWHQITQDLQDGEEYIVYAFYVPEIYQIYFEGIEGERNEYTFNEIIEYPEYPTEPGVAFDGWYNGSIQFAYERVPDLTPKTEGNGSIALSPKTHLIEYSIKYNLNGGDFAAGTAIRRQYTVDSDTYNLVSPIRTGYRFMGWYQNNTFEGEAVTRIESGSIGNREFYAKWAKEYTVTFKYNNVSKKISVIANERVEFPTKEEVGADDDRKYYDGTWTVYAGQSQIATYPVGAIAWQFNQTQNVTIQLSWTAKVYEINYVYEYISSPPVYSYTYGEETYLAAPRQLTQDHSIFRGYYSDPNFTERVSIIGPNEHGNKTFYIKWDYYLKSIFGYGARLVTDEDHMVQEPVNVSVVLPEKNTIEYCNYKSIKIELKMDLWEENDGYQHFFLMDDKNTVLWHLTMEHVPGDGSQERQTYTKTITIDIGSWNENVVRYYYFRFGANGAFSDDWYYTNLEVRVYLSMDEPSKTIEESYQWVPES